MRRQNINMCKTAAISGRFSRMIVGFDGAADAGRLLREVRKRNGISQTALARTTGIGVRTVRRVEHGIAADVATYDIIGQAFGLPREWYLIASSLLDPTAADLVGLADLDQLVGRLTLHGVLDAETARLIVELAEHAVADPDAAARVATGLALQLRRTRTRTGVAG